jgi:ornithine cyclodeaminase
MLIVRHREVRDIVSGRERDIADLVASAYRLHYAGSSLLPHSCFLRMPGNSPNRIIALPAYLPGIAGVKWVSSFPANVAAGMERASAVMVLNSTRTGHPKALIEASLISAQRTAASAAVAAAALAGKSGQGHSGVGLIGCGVINAEILRFLAVTQPSLRKAIAFDISAERARAFAEKCRESLPGVTVTAVADRDEALAAYDLVSVATTASEPHMDLRPCRPEATVLHVSLRDLRVDSILAGQNVVDDADHVCREHTSLHLAEQATKGREFIGACIGEILTQPDDFRREPGKVAIFSPFGLGILDIAVAQFVYDEALRQGMGLRVEDFLPSQQ